MLKTDSVHFSRNTLHKILGVARIEPPLPIQTINTNIVNIKHASSKRANHILVSLLEIFSGCMGMLCVYAYVSGGSELSASHCTAFI